jgi:hypothetical protein
LSPVTTVTPYVCNIEQNCRTAVVGLNFGRTSTTQSIVSIDHGRSGHDDVCNASGSTIRGLCLSYVVWSGGLRALAATRCKQPFREHGVEYERSDKVRSELYLEFLPLVNSGRV